MIWGYHISPMMHGQKAIVLKEFLDERWSVPNHDKAFSEPTVGKVLLKMRGMFMEGYWYWISIGVLRGFALVFNVLFVAALTYLDPLGESKSIILEEDETTKSSSTEKQAAKALDMTPASAAQFSEVAEQAPKQRGMVLPFQPLSLAFNHVNYYVDVPMEMKMQGIEEDSLQLLRDVSGVFRPGVLTALVGVTCKWCWKDNFDGCSCWSENWRVH